MPVQHAANRDPQDRVEEMDGAPNAHGGKVCEALLSPAVGAWMMTIDHGPEIAQSVRSHGVRGRGQGVADTHRFGLACPGGR